MVDKSNGKKNRPDKYSLKMKEKPFHSRQHEKREKKKRREIVVEDSQMDRFPDGRFSWALGEQALDEL